MMTRFFSLLLLFLFTVTPLFAAERPNVVFILTDDLGVMDVGAFNPKTFYETPNIERLGGKNAR